MKIGGEEIISTRRKTSNECNYVLLCCSL